MIKRYRGVGSALYHHLTTNQVSSGKCIDIGQFCNVYKAFNGVPGPRAVLPRTYNSQICDKIFLLLQEKLNIHFLSLTY